MTATDTQTAPSADDVLMSGGGAPTLKLEVQGTFYGGVIVARPQARRETEFGTQTPKTYPSGDPIWGIVVDVQTEERTDPDDDDGVRRLYIEGKGKKDAVRAAVVEAGAPGLEQHGELYLAWVGHGQPANPGISPPKLYQARYTSAANTALKTSPAAAQNGQQPGAATQAAAAHVANTPNTPAQAVANVPADGPLPPGSPTREQVAAMRITMTDEQIQAAFPSFIPALYPPR